VHVDIQDANGVWVWLWCPYGKVGDRLWVREAWDFAMGGAYHYNGQSSATYELRYTADETVHTFEYEGKSGGDPYFALADARDGRRTPIFMPRWASRLTLEITNIRVERLHEMTYADLLAEGVEDKCGYYCSEEVGHVDHAGNWNVFIEKWNALNAKRGHSWETNCWVWAVEFKPIEQHSTKDI
jgi:hypothetical protein